MSNSNKTIPNSLFPQALDDNVNLMEVFNHSESALTRDFTIDDDIIYITPRDWGTARIWSFDGGLINIEGENIYYKEVELENHPNPPRLESGPDFFDNPNISEETKNEYRRVIAFKNLVRISGYNSIPSRSHAKGEIARGYVMSDHHNNLKQAIMGIETLIGIDNSSDKTSIDYRLRDLEELTIEKDDIDCPYGVFWFKILEESQSSITVQFFINIIGDYESFEFVPKEGETPITNNFSPIYTYKKNDFNRTNSNAFIANSNTPIGASLVVNRGDCCACISTTDVPCEPCEFEAALDDLPILTCPEIESWEVPSITFECPEITCQVAEYEPCTTFTCPEVTFPTTIEITGLSEISITIPEIVVSADIPPVTVDINVNWIGGTDDDTGEGACFRLVPCGGTTS